MGKKGPCCHCGVANTPLWRNGPPDKPILCNACGSRWRTKGSLVNYTPLHARVDRDDYGDHRVMKMKSISLKRKDEKLNKRKLNFENRLPMDREFTPNYNQGYLKSIDEDTSNRSSSGSAISNESCAQFSNADASELTDPAQSVVRDALIPSWKRSCVSRPKQSSVRKLTKDLYAILNEQGSQFSASSEEDLLYESEAPMVSVEIGHGSVLIRHPSSMVRDEESEASSLSVENKLGRADESYSNAASLSVNNSFSRVKEVRKLNGQALQMDHLKRSKMYNEEPQKSNFKGGLQRKGSIENDMSYFTPTSRNVFALPNDGSSLMFDSMQHEDEYSDQDLLLDVPPNGFTPEAELLCPSSGFTSHQASASSSYTPI